MNPDPQQTPPLTGLYPAVFTPFDDRSDVVLDRIPAIIDHLAAEGVSGIYICGSTGEGPSMTTPERKDVTAAYLEAARGKLRTVVQVGHSSLRETQLLAEHAAELGAEAISSVAPYYFKPADVADLVASIAETAAAAPGLPFYYYHIPSLTGIALAPLAFLEQGRDAIPNLRGLKYTASDLEELAACRNFDGGRFDVVFGRDEMMLSALELGCRGFVGSTYNFAPALYRAIVAAFDAGRMEEAGQLQERAKKMIAAITACGGEAAVKFPMKLIGLDCGQRRLPMHQLMAAEQGQIEAGLKVLGFAKWAVSGGVGTPGSLPRFA